MQNTAKAGDVAALRDAQKLLANRKAIAMGARAEYDEKKKLRDQVHATMSSPWLPPLEPSTCSLHRTTMSIIFACGLLTIRLVVVWVVPGGREDSRS